MDPILKSLYVDVLLRGYNIKVHLRYKSMVVIVGWHQQRSVSKYYALTHSHELIGEFNWNFFQNQEHKVTTARRKK